MIKISIRDYGLDENGGIRLTNKEELDNAHMAVLITMPKDITGTSCGNCKFFSKEYCNHPQMKLPVNEKQCCNYWNRVGTYFPE